MLNDEAIEASKNYWTSHNVNLHHSFVSAEESLNWLDWRNKQYFGYDSLMPTSGFDGKTVLDFGCGPGHDLVGFGTRSETRRLIGIDVSPTSLKEAAARLSLHGVEAELYETDIQRHKIDMPDQSVDVVHCSGVLHHMAHPDIVLAEFRRILRDDGILQAMVYNRQSIWFHLYVPYVLQIDQGKLVGFDIDEAFKRSTDGPDCPVSRCYTKEQFQELVRHHGFELERFGSAVACTEMICLSQRYHALLSQALHGRHRKFLHDLTFNERGFPMSDGEVAGIDGCYLFRARNAKP